MTFEDNMKMKGYPGIGGIPEGLSLTQSSILVGAKLPMTPACFRELGWQCLVQSGRQGKVNTNQNGINGAK